MWHDVRWCDPFSSARRLGHRRQVLQSPCSLSECRSPGWEICWTCQAWPWRRPGHGGHGGQQCGNLLVTFQNQKTDSVHVWNPEKVSNCQSFHSVSPIYKGFTQFIHLQNSTNLKWNNEWNARWEKNAFNCVQLQAALRLLCSSDIFVRAVQITGGQKTRRHWPCEEFANGVEWDMFIISSHNLGISSYCNMSFWLSAQVVEWLPQPLCLSEWLSGCRATLSDWVAE